MPRYVALFRGINVGKAKRIAMADLRALLEKLGYTDVKTLLNSGNAVFTGAPEPPAKHRRAHPRRGSKKARRGCAGDRQIRTRTSRRIIAGNALAKIATDPRACWWR